MRRRTVSPIKGGVVGKAIGVFDSGLGGLTVFRELRKRLPAEDIIYFGDTARVPYGSKSRDTVVRFSLENAGFLAGLGVKMIVVACNTSSSCSLPLLRRVHRIPIIGVVEPGVPTALKATLNGRIGLIGTRATVSSGVYEKALRRAGKGIRVFSRACPLFVPLVEEGWTRRDLTYSVAEYYLRPLRKRRIDTLILGCTHYPLLKGIIGRVMGKGVVLVDSAFQTAMRVSEILRENGIENTRSRGSDSFYVSDEVNMFRRVGSRFFGSRIDEVKKVDVK